jgi:small-conductance mechanosensitive channel
MDIKWLFSALVGYKEYFVLLFLIFAARFLAIGIYKRRKKVKAKDNYVIGLNNLTYVLLSILIFFFILQLFGITLKDFFTSITIIAAALAIVFKDYILNGLNGMLLMFGETLQIGDHIKVGDHKGTIQNITLMNVHLNSNDEDLIIIPNNTFVNSEITNYSRNPRHNSSIEFEVRSAQSIDAIKLEEQLIKAMEAEMGNIRQGSQRLRIVEFKNDLVHYRFRFGLQQYDSKEETRIKQILWKEILRIINVQKPVKH